MNLRATGTVQRVYSLLLTRYLKKTIIPLKDRIRRNCPGPSPLDLWTRIPASKVQSVRATATCSQGRHTSALSFGEGPRTGQCDVSSNLAHHTRMKAVELVQATDSAGTHTCRISGACSRGRRRVDSGACARASRRGHMVHVWLLLRLSRAALPLVPFASNDRRASSRSLRRALNLNSNFRGPLSSVSSAYFHGSQGDPPRLQKRSRRACGESRLAERQRILQKNEGETRTKNEHRTRADRAPSTDRGRRTG